MADLIRVETVDGVATVTLNRPDKLNALSPEVFEALRMAGAQIEKDPQVRAVLIRGEGRAFSSGLDLSALGGEMLGTSTPVALRQVIRQVQEGFAVWARMTKPVVAAVHGYALGGGLQLALAADIRLCAAGTVLSVAEITYGLVPDLGGTHHLPRLVGPAIAKELTWTGRRFDSTEALALGLVNRVVPLEALQKESLTLTREIAAKPPIAIALAKQLLSDAHELGIEDNLRRVADAQATCILSNDFREAVSAALEKRVGSYTGT
jgi:enoyl-CoA hydratase/carnithine racemase